MIKILILSLRRILGIFILPFLYVRYSFIFFTPILFIENIPNEYFLFLWFIYVIFAINVMGVFGLFKYWTKLFQWIFKVKYERVGYWMTEFMHSYSVWSHPIIKVRNKEYKLAISVMGGNLYEEEDKIRRTAIFYWFFG